MNYLAGFRFGAIVRIAAVTLLTFLIVGCATVRPNFPLHALYVERHGDPDIQNVKIYYGDSRHEYPEITWKRTPLGTVYRNTPLPDDILITWIAGGKSHAKHILLEEKIGAKAAFVSWIVVFRQNAMELHRQSKIQSEKPRVFVGSRITVDRFSF